MSFTTPTVADFKAQFDRDFPYAVPANGAVAALTLGALGVIAGATLKANGTGYLVAPTCTVVDDGTPAGAGATVTATVANGMVTGLTITAPGAGYLQPRLVFTGGAGDETDKTRIRDSDITGAIVDASFNVNMGLFPDQATWARAFLYLAAHNLVQRLLAAGEGMKSRFSWLTNAKTVGDLSESYTIPDSILESPFLSSISTTRYGARYLEIISPLLVGNMQTNFRQTPP